MLAIDLGAVSAPLLRPLASECHRRRGRSDPEGWIVLMPPMHPIQAELEAALTTAIERLEGDRLAGDLVDRLRRLAAQVREPFLLAVVGRVKAGKSTLVNALIGHDLPTVGATEATATVNWFRHGSAEDLGRVYCYRNGSDTPEVRPLSELEHLQGDSPATLERVAAIDRLEFRLPVDWLRSLVLVDTPGLNAVASEHQDRTASFVGLSSQLRRRNSETTLRMSREADAILYVLPPALAEKDLSFLEEFRRASRVDSTLCNAIAVLGKMDWFSTDTSQWGSYTHDAAQKLGRAVRGVLPVSVGLHRYADHLRRDRGALELYHRLIGTVPDPNFEDMIDSEAHVVGGEGLPFSVEERRSLRGDCPWPAYQAAALAGRALRPAGPEGAIDALVQCAGLAGVRRMIDDEFLAWGPLLRCQRIAEDAENLLLDPLAGGAALVARLAADDHAERLELGRYVALLDRLRPTLLVQDRPIAESLRRFVESRRATIGRAPAARSCLAEALRPIATCRRRVDELVIGQDSLRLLADVSQLLPVDQSEELERLFSCVGPGRSPERAPGELLPGRNHEREQFWRTRDHVDDRVRLICERAAILYGSLSAAESRHRVE